MTLLYSNENFPLPVVEELRRLGHDVLTVLETGKAGMAWSDEDVLAFSAAENRVLLTLNRKHFLRLHATRPDHAGIVLCTLDTDFARQARRIHEALLKPVTAAGKSFASIARIPARHHLHNGALGGTYPSSRICASRNRALLVGARGPNRLFL